jgi:hypothetical protein
LEIIGEAVKRLSPDPLLFKWRFFYIESGKMSGHEFWKR